MYVKVGLLIFWFAFILCIPGEIMFIGEPWRLSDILDANPHLYLRELCYAFLYLILPPAVGVAFTIIGYIKKRKTFFKWQLVVAGGIILFWGFWELQSTYAAYYVALDEARILKAHINNLLLTIYATLSVADILWLFEGAFLISVYIHKTLTKTKFSP